VSPRLRRGVFALLLGVSLAMFLTPGGSVSAGAPNDKLVHLLTFAGLVAAGRWARVPPARLGLGLVAYAGLTEVLQAVLPVDRHGDVRDLAADVAGVLLGLVLSGAAERVGQARSRARRGAPSPSPPPG
jgi:hypothetical protein